VVTLLVPELNDGEEELSGIARFLASVSPDLPWHVTAFHPDYKMRSPRPTTASDLERAASIGREAGLRHVYAGNLPGKVGALEDTICPGCGAAVVERTGYRVRAVRLDGGACAACGTAIPGRWVA
jgi:pyruvate formate lyase activating enzyme